MFDYLVHSGTVYTHRVSLRPDSKKEDICEQRFHVILRVTITLGNIGLIRDLSNGLDILLEERNLPTIRILLEVLQDFRSLSKDQWLI
jgi:hypothetical protein